jgi:putative oxidoreductase
VYPGGGEIGTPLVSWVILVEFFAALLLFAGFLTRLAAIALLGITAGAIGYATNQEGFFSYWSGSLAGIGYEFQILAAAVCLALLIKGGGSASVDKVLTDIATLS